MKRLRFILITVLFIVFNSISIYSISDNSGLEQNNLTIQFFIDIIVVSGVYIFLLAELKNLKNDRITIPLLFLLFVINLIWMLVDIKNSSDTSLLTKLIFSIPIEIIITIAAIRLLMVAWNKENNGNTYFITSFVVANLIVLIPIMGIIGNSEAVKTLLINLLYLSLAFTYFRKIESIRKLESPVHIELILNDSESAREEFDLLRVCSQYDLTSKEKETLMLMINGYSNKQIAKHIYIAEGTARKHVSNIYSKVGGVKNRSQLFKKLGVPKK